MSPYVAFNNNPLRFTDNNGLEGQDWVKGGTNSKGTIKYDADTWHWEKDVKTKDDAEKLGAVDWMPKNESRTIQTLGGKMATISYDSHMDNGKVEYQNSNDIPEATVEKLSANGAFDETNYKHGEITNPGAGLFMIGNNTSDFFELRKSWGSSNSWEQFYGYVNSFAWQAVLFAGGEAFMGFIPSGGLHSNVIRGGNNATKTGNSISNSIVKTGNQLSYHAEVERFALRGVSPKMTQTTINKGLRYFDPKNGTINYVLRNGFASGKDILVGTNPLSGKVTTVIRGNKLIRPRFINLNP